MKTMNLRLRIVLFFIILVLGTTIALMTAETTGLALTDLSNVSVDTLTHTADNSSLFATMDGAGIYRSNDAGYSWQMVSTGPSGQDVRALVIQPDNVMSLYASTINEEGRSSLWHSNDGGKHWLKVPFELPVNGMDRHPVINVLALDAAAADVLYAGTEGQGMYRVDLKTGQSELLGDESTADLYVRDLDLGATERIYAVTTEGLFVVEGSTVEMLENLPDTPVSLAVDPTNPMRLYAGTVAYGAFVSNDGGRTWQDLNTGFGWQPGIMFRVPAIAIDKDKPQHLAVATAYSIGSHLLGDGIYESFNGGQHWVKIAENQDVVDQLVIQGGGVYAATTQGLVRYGNPLPAASLTSSLHLQSLANPTGIQLLILTLTAGLAAWVLLGQFIGKSPQKQSPA
ncbi:MAG: hypothetical protein H6631_15690 [Anaerolineaceae bacterium]|nr:hypothetical protein [Anaerolineaceae bacterium]